MWFFNQTSPAARVALIYITVGALIVVWTGVWFAFLFNNPADSQTPYYFATGFLITGLTLLGIGFSVGQIGQTARKADDLPANRPTNVVTPVNPPAVAPAANGAVAAPAAPGTVPAAAAPATVPAAPAAAPPQSPVATG